MFCPLFLEVPVLRSVCTGKKGWGAFCRIENTPAPEDVADWKWRRSERRFAPDEGPRHSAGPAGAESSRAESGREAGGGLGRAAREASGKADGILGFG